MRGHSLRSQRREPLEYSISSLLRFAFFENIVDRLRSILKLSRLMPVQDQDQSNQLHLCPEISLRQF